LWIAVGARQVPVRETVSAKRVESSPPSTLGLQHTNRPSRDVTSHAAHKQCFVSDEL
jgi:hypothetical protein